MASNTKPLKIDIHTHILPRDWPVDLKEKFGYGGFIRLVHCCDGKTKMMQDDKFFRLVEPNCFDPETRIKECDEQGVDVQVLSTVPVMFSYWAKPEDCLEISKWLNEDLADICKRHPTRFIGLGTLPMQAPDLAVQELRRCVLELGLAGVQIGSHINDWNLDAPELFPIFEEAERLGAAIFVHPWDMMGQEKMPDYWLPWLVGMPAETCLAICSMIFGGVFERLPNLKVCFAHGGGSFPGTISRIEHGFNVRPDLCAIRNPVNPKAYLGRFWVDSLTHCSVLLKYLADLMGKDKIMLGTDYPFPLGELEPGKTIEESEFDDETKALMLGENCLRFLGLEKEKFIRSKSEVEDTQSS